MHKKARILLRNSIRRQSEAKGIKDTQGKKGVIKGTSAFTCACCPIQKLQPPWLQQIERTIDDDLFRVTKKPERDTIF